MDWEFLARHLGLYTVLLGGGTVGLTFVLPRTVGPYALLAAIAVGMLLFGRAALDNGGGGPTSGGSPAGAAHGLSENSAIFAPRDPDESLGAGLLFYAIGLVFFGIAGLVMLM